MDHKVLPNKLAGKYTAILVLKDSFSGWTLYEVVEDQTTETTARAVIKRIIPNFEIRGLCSDRGGGLISKVMKKFNENIRNWTMA